MCAKKHNADSVYEVEKNETESEKEDKRRLDQYSKTVATFHIV
jgi:hypothetical protein